MPLPAPFCLCADDFALSPSVSRGIIEALSAKRLSATGAMTTRPAWPLGARELQPFKSIADIGLHLNLTLGHPIGPMPTLAPQGDLPGISKLARSALSKNLPVDEISGEIARQLDRFTEEFGAPPAFIDGHHHVHVLPQVRSLLFTRLEERGLQAKVWLRTSTDRLSRILRRGRHAGKALAAVWIAWGFAEEASRRGFAMNDGFSGFSAFDPKSDYADEFEHSVIAPGPRHLVMCHPGYCDEELAAADRVTVRREQELKFLLSPAFAELLDRKGLRLARLSDVIASEKI